MCNTDLAFLKMPMEQKDNIPLSCSNAHVSRVSFVYIDCYFMLPTPQTKTHEKHNHLRLYFSLDQEVDEHLEPAG